MLQQDTGASHFELLSKRRAYDVYVRLRKMRADTKTSICTLGARRVAHITSVMVRKELQRHYMIAKAARRSLVMTLRFQSTQELLSRLRACSAVVRGKSVGLSPKTLDVPHLLKNPRHKLKHAITATFRALSAPNGTHGPRHRVANEDSSPGCLYICGIFPPIFHPNNPTMERKEIPWCSGTSGHSLIVPQCIST